MTELEQLSIDQFLVLERADGLRVGVAELFHEGVSDGIIVVQTQWLFTDGHPFHKTEGAVQKIDGEHWAVGDNKIFIADPVTDVEIVRQLNDWESFKSTNSGGSRDRALSKAREIFEKEF